MKPPVEEGTRACPASQSSDRETRRAVTLVLTPASGNWRSSADRRLALLLKTCLRSFGWRCLSAREVPQGETPGQKSQEQRCAQRTRQE